MKISITIFFLPLSLLWPIFVGAMQPDSEWALFLQNDGQYGLVDTQAEACVVDDFVTAQYEKLRELEIENAKKLISIVASDEREQATIDKLGKALESIDINSKDDCEENVLHKVVRQKKLDVIRYLAAKNIKLSEKNLFGDTPLLIAAYLGNSGAAKCLAEQGAELDDKSRGGERVLHKVVRNSDFESVKFFVDRSVAIDTEDDNQWTALHCAAWEGQSYNASQYRKIIRLLVERGANVKSQANGNKTAFQLATVPMIKAYLKLVEDFYAANENKFGEFANKYLVNSDEKSENLTDIYNLLHLGTQDFIVRFVLCVGKYGLPRFGDGDEIKWILFDCAMRPGPKKNGWIKACLSYCFVEKKYWYDEDFYEIEVNKLIKKLPIKERDQLTKEKNKVLQQKKCFATIQKGVKITKMATNKCKKKFVDTRLYFN